jgi:nitroreductase
MPDISRQLAHRSVRSYSDRPIEEETMQGLIAAAQSAATSSNLQLWSVVSVQDPERRGKIAELCDNQSQVRECSWFLAFLADHHRIHRAASLIGSDADGLGYAEFTIMALIDASLAAERLVCTAESIGIGICYIGALRNDPPGVKELLQLPSRTFACFGLCLGYPKEPIRAEIKPRLSQESVWFRETYDQSVSVSEYDERMRGFYESQKMKGDVTWSMRSARRVDRHHMTGREGIRDWLISQGFWQE